MARPNKSEAERRSRTIGVRVNPDLLARLSAAAAESGRSLAGEAELRLRRSFEPEERFGGPFMYYLLRVMAERIRVIESEDGGRWFESKWAFADVEALVLEMLRHFKPRGRLKPPKRAATQQRQPGELGRHMALLGLAQLEDAMRCGADHATVGAVNPFVAAGPVVGKMTRSALAAFEPKDGWAAADDFKKLPKRRSKAT